MGLWSPGNGDGYKGPGRMAASGQPTGHALLLLTQLGLGTDIARPAQQQQLLPRDQQSI